MSKSVILFMMILLLAAVPSGLLITYLLCGRHDEEENEEEYLYQRAMQNDGTFFKPQSEWLLELTNIRSGVRIGKSFNGYLFLGRMTQLSEPVKYMYLDPDQTISRCHCRIFDSGYGVSVENMSRVNGTKLNGYPLQQPKKLQYGDLLDIGHERYLVSGLYRVA